MPRPERSPAPRFCGAFRAERRPASERYGHQKRDIGAVPSGSNSCSNPMAVPCRPFPQINLKLRSVIPSFPGTPLPQTGFSTHQPAFFFLRPSAISFASRSRALVETPRPGPRSRRIHGVFPLREVPVALFHHRPPGFQPDTIPFLSVILYLPSFFPSFAETGMTPSRSR